MMIMLNEMMMQNDYMQNPAEVSTDCSLQASQFCSLTNPTNIALFHAAGAGFVLLNMKGTLEENGIKDETEEFVQLGMNEDLFMPILHVYFNDDLTIA
jgi:hypothetical protein